MRHKSYKYLIMIWDRGIRVRFIMIYVENQEPLISGTQGHTFAAGGRYTLGSTLRKISFILRQTAQIRGRDRRYTGESMWEGTNTIKHKH